MPIVDFGRMDGDASFEDLLEAFAKVQKMLDFLMQGGLDSKNAREFGGWSVGNTELQSKDKTVGMSTESTGIDDIRFWAGDLKTGAPNFKVTEAGIASLISALIQSSTGYPRVELNSSTDIIAAYQDANNHIDINPVSGGAPAINWFAAGAFAASLSTSSTVTTLLSAVQLLLQSTGNMTITSSAGNISLNPSGSTSLNGPTVALNPSGSLSINGSSGSSGGLTYAKPGGGSGTITITKGLITGFT